MKEQAIFQHHRLNDNRIYIGLVGGNEVLFKQIVKFGNGEFLNGREVVIEPWNNSYTTDSYDVLFISNVEGWMFKDMTQRADDGGTLSITDMGGVLADAADVRLWFAGNDFEMSFNERAIGELIDVEGWEMGAR